MEPFPSPGQGAGGHVGFFRLVDSNLAVLLPGQGWAIEGLARGHVVRAIMCVALVEVSDRRRWCAGASGGGRSNEC